MTATKLIRQVRSRVYGTTKPLRDGLEQCFLTQEVWQPNKE